MDWLNVGAIVAGVVVLIAWYKADNAATSSPVGHG